ncbi:hypothetical protein [Acinetobacter rathckeae]|uniref:hypothetical protein n=1 Tax=Acinetobacter rathckeae TaxID=2605272 RepID=UPI0018A33085|nr:hypothetical protein [Acinetobacter rathckeae]MBF7695869.1 hypothetical protein [Acinetobacter rathckeae]
MMKPEQILKAIQLSETLALFQLDLCKKGVRTGIADEILAIAEAQNMSVDDASVALKAQYDTAYVAYQKKHDEAVQVYDDCIAEHQAEISQLKRALNQSISMASSKQGYIKAYKLKQHEQLMTLKGSGLSQEQINAVTALQTSLDEKGIEAEVLQLEQQAKEQQAQIDEIYQLAKSKQLKVLFGNAVNMLEASAV